MNHGLGDSAGVHRSVGTCFREQCVAYQDKSAREGSIYHDALQHTLLIIPFAFEQGDA